MFLANVTFEPGCRNDWHIHHATGGSGMGGENILKSACSNETRWLPGKRLSSRESATSVQKWIDSLKA